MHIRKRTITTAPFYEATSRRSFCTCSYNTFIYDDDYVLMIVMMMKMMMMTMLMMMMMMLMLLNWAGLSAGLLGWLGRFGSVSIKILIKNLMILGSSAGWVGSGPISI